MTAANALTRTAVVYNRRQRIDRYDEFVLNDYGWRVRFGSRITKHGTPSREWMSADGLQRDEGQATEVTIVKAWLLNSAGTVEQALPLSIFPLDMLIDHETEIGKLNDEEKS